MDLILESLVKYGFRVMGGVIVLVAGWIVAQCVAKFFKNFLERKKIDVTVTKFLTSIAKLLILAFALLIALSQFGIEITPLIAGFSVAGVGVGLAMQGTLSNYAAGTSLIFTKPFKVGDVIEVAGVTGEVKDINFGSTSLVNVDGVKITVPNKHIIGEVIQNYAGLKKVSLKVGIGYDSDVDKAIRIVRDLLREDKKILREKEPKIGISEFADSSLTLSAHFWCQQSDYLDVLFGIHKGILEAFRIHEITIPFPQRDLHLTPEGEEAPLPASRRKEQQ